MTLPKPQPCDCFGGNCWRKYCPDSSRNRKRRRDSEPAAQPPADGAAHPPKSAVPLAYRDTLEAMRERGER